MPRLSQKILRYVSADALIQRSMLLAFLAFFTLFFILPVAALLYRSLTDAEGEFIGFTNYASYASGPALWDSLGNSLFVGCLTTLLTLLLAFPFAYGLARSRMPMRGTFMVLGMLPLLAPPMLFAISIRYLFNSQGPLGWILGEHLIYGPIGIVMGEVFYAFPPVMLILLTGLSAIDGRLVEAAQSLAATPLRSFWTVTLPAARYSIVSAGIVAFIQSITDFGIPKIIGGQYNLLATDIYKQVIGQMDFSMGAVIGVVMLIPAALCFAIDRKIRKMNVSSITAQSVPYSPKQNYRLDLLMFLYCGVVSAMVVGCIVFAGYVSLVTYWPYNLDLTWSHYDLGAVDPRGWGAYANSLHLSIVCMVVGTACTWLCAYFVSVLREFPPATLVHSAGILPLSVPGLVLGLAYILFFIDPANPLHPLYGTFALLVLSVVVHHFTIGYTIANVGLAQIDREIHAIGASLGVPFYRTVGRIIVPISTPVILEIAAYYFIIGMTTTSTVIFLYTSQTMPASVSILHLDENGNLASAAALSFVVFVTCLVARGLQVFATRGLVLRTQQWRSPRVATVVGPG
jgi:iron(III) transport system permease protein